MDGPILKWGVSVVSIVQALRWTSSARVIQRAYGAGDNSKRVTRGSQFTTMEQERKRGIERLGKRQATTPHRPVKIPALLEA